MSEWLLVSGDFRPLGGMDSANHALASYLARHAGGPVHLVSHSVSEALRTSATVRARVVPRPLGAHLLGEPLLRREAERVAREVRGRGGRVIANGGNVDAGDVTWVHYLHAAYAPAVAGRTDRLVGSVKRAKYLREEARALAHARLVICNSDRTAADVVERLAIDASRVRRVYYGTDPVRYSPGPTMTFPAGGERPTVLFVGALGDRRKGFDTVLDGWAIACRRPDWDAHLCVAGSGSELDRWKARVAGDAALRGRVEFLGYREDVPALLRAADLVVHPARYEAYGLAVHEALCCGVPAIVSRTAGVAECYPEDLRPLLLDDPERAGELAERLQAWRAQPQAWQARARAAGASLRRRTWDFMAQEIVEAVQAS